MRGDARRGRNVVLGLAVLLLGASATGAKAADEMVDRYVVVAAAKLRSKPNKDAPVLGERKRGDLVWITGKPTGEWLPTFVPNPKADPNSWAGRNLDAWVHKDDVGSNEEARIAAGKLRDVLKNMLGEGPDQERKARGRCLLESPTDPDLQSQCVEAERQSWMGMRDEAKRYPPGKPQRQKLIKCASEALDAQGNVVWTIAYSCALATVSDSE